MAKCIPGGGASQRLHADAQSIRRNWQLHLLILVPITYVLIFYYIPMYGAQIAFRDYRPRYGITGSEWVGLKWFKKFFNNYKFWDILINTLRISFYSLATFPLPVVFALMLNAVPRERFKKVTQTISYMPHFISVVIVVTILDIILSPINGVYGVFYRLLGGVGIARDFRADSNAFVHMYIWSGVWQTLGWNTIIYTAALSAVSQEHHEAAMLDGATRLQRMIHVDLPAIMPTVGITLIMRCGSIMAVGFEKVYLMQRTTNISVSEIISTHVYKVGMGSTLDMSYAAAIGLFNSLVNCIMLITVNWISKKVSQDEVSMF